MDQQTDDDILFSWAKQFSLISHRELTANDFLQGRVVGCLFFENSTRTYLSFYIAARKLSAEMGKMNNRRKPFWMRLLVAARY